MADGVQGETFDGDRDMAGMAEEVGIEIDLEQLFIDDLELIGDLATGQVAGKALLDLLDRVVVGGVRGRGWRFTQLREIGAALTAAMNDAANPGN
jgi:hypothetical protein